MARKINMNVQRCGHKGWYDDGTRVFERRSRWLSVKQNYNPSPRNSLWDYVTDGSGYKPYDKRFDPKDGLYLDYFTYEGRNYAIEQFLALGNPFWCPVIYTYQDRSGKVHYLSGVDGDEYYHPIYIEMDECCGRVRVYTECK